MLFHVEIYSQKTQSWPVHKKISHKTRPAQEAIRNFRDIIKSKAKKCQYFKQ